MAANTLVTGQTGAVTFTNRGARIASWSADLTTEVYDSSGFANSGWRTNANGMKSLSGSAAGFLTQGSATDQPNFTGLTAGDTVGVPVVLTANTGCTYTFNAHISHIRIDDRIDANGAIVFDFVSTGAVTEAWILS